MKFLILKAYQGEIQEIEEEANFWLMLKDCQVDETIKISIGNNGEYSNLFMKKIIQRVAEGDTVIFHDMAMIVKSFRELFDFLMLLREKKVIIADMKTNLIVNCFRPDKEDEQIFRAWEFLESTSKRGKANRIKQGQKGLKGGRPRGKSGRKIDHRKTWIKKELLKGSTIDFIAHTLGVSRMTIWRWKKDNKEFLEE